jgi:hypothetical protein
MTVARRTLRVLGRGAVMLLFALVLAELALQGAAFFVRDRAAPRKILSLEIGRDVFRAIFGGPLAELTFDADTAGGQAVVSGACARTTSGCASGGGCYRWNPQGTVCNVRQPVMASHQPLRVSARFRVAAFPSGMGSDLLGLAEDAYGTGIYVQFTNRDQLRLLAMGSQRAEGTCGPLAAHVAPDVWYELRVRAAKSDHAQATLELLTPDGEVIDTVTCTDLPAGGGTFTQLFVGSSSRFGATADVTVDDVTVHEAPS